ncbi:hypothetical protein ZWY2020_015043 [Hordeum vulgare]|nr:hypothetical protein ZWY2020_015043 [Hordeum vulgare]
MRQPTQPEFRNIPTSTSPSTFFPKRPLTACATAHRSKPTPRPPAASGGGEAASEDAVQQPGPVGAAVSQLSYGAWVTFGNQLDVKEAKSLLQACCDAGVNFFDNAEVYANGRAEETAARRSGTSAGAAPTSSSPPSFFWGARGPTTRASPASTSSRAPRPPQAARHGVRRRDHRGAGVANRLDLVGPIVEQPEYNLFSRHKVESEFVPLYSTYGIGLTTWSPLASGVLTGKYSKGNILLKESERAQTDRFRARVSMAQLGIAWCAPNLNVSSVITGATKESQIVENMKALEVVLLLTPEVLEKIEAVIQSKPKRHESYR